MLLAYTRISEIKLNYRTTQGDENVGLCPRVVGGTGLARPRKNASIQNAFRLLPSNPKKMEWPAPIRCRLQLGLQGFQGPGATTFYVMPTNAVH